MENARKKKADDEFRLTPPEPEGKPSLRQQDAYREEAEKRLERRSETGKAVVRSDPQWTERKNLRVKKAARQAADRNDPSLLIEPTVINLPRWVKGALDASLDWWNINRRMAAVRYLTRNDLFNASAEALLDGDNLEAILEHVADDEDLIDRFKRVMRRGIHVWQIQRLNPALPDPVVEALVGALLANEQLNALIHGARGDLKVLLKRLQAVVDSGLVIADDAGRITQGMQRKTAAKRIRQIWQAGLAQYQIDINSEDYDDDGEAADTTD